MDTKDVAAVLLKAIGLVMLAYACSSFHYIFPHA